MGFFKKERTSKYLNDVNQRKLLYSFLTALKKQKGFFIFSLENKTFFFQFFQPTFITSFKIIFSIFIVVIIINIYSDKIPVIWRYFENSISFSQFLRIIFKGFSYYSVEIQNNNLIS